MTEDFKIILESYIKAGKAVVAAKKLAKKLVEPGAKFLNIAEECESEILKNGTELAFPINMSLNEHAAHYSPTIGDQTIVPEKGLLKIDLGAHYNGYIADSAFTINLDEDPALQNYIDAANEGLEAAIERFTPGTLLYELGEAIEDKILKRGLKPITNLGGHQLKQYDLHAGPFIPNHKDTHHDKMLEPGDAYACEPFSTSGAGLVVNGKHSYIYRLDKKVKKNMSYEDKNYMSKIEKICGRLPFSPRILASTDTIPRAKIDRVINNFVRKQVLAHYPILIERTGALVAQQEHTIVLDMNGNTIVTTRE
ncbi:MAG: type II methionyl aminopeptidase [Candidatus Lokiarchaeota archaeon]|nr:type II methionyl aminopeptidase [Candidatus Lokiarchaeota archaeon]